jgi:hypothetical protein
MTIVDGLAVLRIVIYALMAAFALKQRRWLVWATFTSLVGSTYVYAFTDISPLATELIRTMVACMLVSITIRRS